METFSFSLLTAQFQLVLDKAGWLSYTDNSTNIGTSAALPPRKGRLTLLWCRAAAILIGILRFRQPLEVA